MPKVISEDERVSATLAKEADKDYLRAEAILNEGNADPSIISPTPVITICLFTAGFSGSEDDPITDKGDGNAGLKLFSNNKDIRISLSDLVII